MKNEMPIYVARDTCGEQSRISLIECETRIGAGDYLLVCGDFGFIFRNDTQEGDYLNFPAQKDYTILFVEGNHANFAASTLWFSTKIIE